MQKNVEKAFRAAGPLPVDLELAHHNAIAGLDRWRGVRAVIVVGRTLHGPKAVEAIAERLTGRAVTPVAGWYPKLPMAQELANDPPEMIETDGHPDVMAEAIQWQISEGELVQIIGRGRGVSRTNNTPLDVLVMCNVPIPMPVPMLVEAAAIQPSPADPMIAAGGTFLTNPRMRRRHIQSSGPIGMRPKRRSSDGEPVGHKPLKGVFYRGMSQLVPITYQLGGERQKRASARVDLVAVPNAQA